MASSLIIHRRSLRALSVLHHSFLATSTLPISAHSSSSSSSSCSRRESSPNFVGVQSRSFRSTSISLLSSRYTEIPDEIGPDTILFEGCDYNHWLFVMDFPKDNKPSPEEMIRTYEETCAKGLNISVEEAKKKIYACSTTTYTGFQAVVTEEESKKFESLPGVIFVLPDSYIDPVNKQYGGDQYIDGTIIPRPPPIQYGRNQGGKRDFNRQGQGNPSYNNQGGRNFGPSQNYPPQQGSQGYPPQQSHGQTSQGYPPQQNYLPPRNIDQASQSYSQPQTFGSAPPQQGFGSPGQGERRNYAPQQNFGPPGQGERRNYAPQQNFGPPGQGERGNFAPQQNFGPPRQGERANFAPQQNFGPPRQDERGNFAPQQNFGQTGQAERGSFAQQQNFGPPRHGERRDSVPTEGGWDFKPSYMEEFEQADKGNHHAKEQSGSQQRFPPPGPSNFT